MSPFGLRLLSGYDFIVKPDHYTITSTVERWPAHPLIVWLFAKINSVFGTSLDPDITRRVEVVKDLPMVQFGNRVFCSPAQFAALKEEMRRREQGSRV